MYWAKDNEKIIIGKFYKQKDRHRWMEGGKYYTLQFTIFNIGK